MPDSSIDITSRTRISLDQRLIGIRLLDKQLSMSYIILIARFVKFIWWGKIDLISQWILFVYLVIVARFVYSRVIQKFVSW